MRTCLSILTVAAAMWLAVPALADDAAPAAPPAPAPAAAEPAPPAPQAAAGTCTLGSGQYAAGTVFTAPSSCDESGYCTTQVCWRGAWYKHTLGCSQKAQTCPAFAPQ